MRSASSCSSRLYNSKTSRPVLRVRCQAGRPRVVVTREAGKNAKLVKALEQHNISCVELPLIEHAAGPDKERLPGMLQAGGFDWVAITSPEAATVFLEGWRAAGSPEVRLAVVGAGTGEVLEAAGVKPAFTATKALGKVMGSELPHIAGGGDVVLYPSSAKASTDLQDSLTAAGFKVTRINTYNTVGITNVDPQALQQALAADAITFGSPSAVKAWVALVGLEAAQKMMSVCIGSTSARACNTAGLTKVIYPDAPSIESWVECVLEALQQQPVAAA